MLNVAPAALIMSLIASGLPLAVAATGKVAPCGTAKTDFCDLPRAEDIAAIPGTDWLLVGRDTSDGGAPLALLDARRHRRVDLRPMLGAGSAPDCAVETLSLRAGGLDVRRIGREIIAAVIDHASRDRVQLFTVRIGHGAPTFQWRRCIAVPAPWALNDVALAPGGDLYATHMFERPTSPEAAAQLKSAFLGRQPTGFAVRWHEVGGWSRVSDTERAFANGIAVDDQGVVAVAGTFDQDVLLIARDGTTRRVALALQPDNITRAPGGGFVVAGHTGIPVIGVDPCRPVSSLPCGFPFAVANLDTKGRARMLFEHDGGRIPGASVSLLRKQRLYLGSAFGDRVTVLDLSSYYGRMAR